MQKNFTSIFNVEGGSIKGLLSDDKAVNIFKGIPYAAPPVGSLRWKAPQPVIKWEGVKECTSWAKSAIQEKQAPFMAWTKEFIIDDTLGYSEDCLYLNVWSANDNLKNKPVIIYIHGGNFIAGGSSCEVYDGENLARAGVVLVSINFRIGLLGLLSTSALSSENDRKISGNYQLLDQIAAINWVRNNIAQFGGDPDNITLMGQSSGSGAVNTLAVSPLVKGKIKNIVALGHSTFNYPVAQVANTDPEVKGKFKGENIYRKLSECEAMGDKLFEGKTLEQMRAMSPEEILKLPVQFLPYCIDDYVLTCTFRDGVEKGLTNEINYLFGMDDNDRFLFTIVNIDFSKPEQYVPEAKKVFGPLADEFLKAYPPESFPGSFMNLLIDYLLLNDAQFAKARVKAGSTDNTWLMTFRHVLPGPESAAWGAFHSSEVPFYFNNLKLKEITEYRKDYLTEKDFAVAERMSGLLVNFAKTGNPNGNGLPEWKPNVIYNFDTDKFAPDTDFTQAKLDLWEKKYPLV